MAGETSFIQKLRMANIFPSGNEAPANVPFGMPTMGSGIDFNQLLGDIQWQNLKADERQRNQFLEDRTHNEMRQDRLMDRTDPNKQPKNMRVILNNIDPLQQEKLNVAREGLDVKRELGSQKLDINRRDSDIRQQRANVYDFKAKNPQMKIIMPKGGNVTAVNPITGEMHDLGVPTGTLSEQERLELTGEQRMGEIGARGDIQKDIQNTRGQQNLAQIAARVAGQKEVNAAKPDKDETPAQLRTTIQNAAHQLMNTRPELSQFIKDDGRGNPINTAPQGSPEWEMINNALYSSNKDTKLTPDNKSGNKDEVIEKVKVEKDGKQFMLPKNQVEDATKQGYTLVK